MKNKLFQKFSPVGISVLVSVVLVFSVCLFVTGYFSAVNFLKAEKKSVALYAENLSQKSILFMNEQFKKMSGLVSTRRNMLFHPDSAMALCREYAVKSGVPCRVFLEYIPDFFPGRRYFAPCYETETDTGGDLTDYDGYGAYYKTDSLFVNAPYRKRILSYDRFVYPKYEGDDYIRVTIPFYTDEGKFFCLLNILYYVDILDESINSQFGSFADENNCYILIDSSGRYFKKTPTVSTFCVDNSANFLDSVRIYWGEEVFSSLQKALEGDDYQSIHEVEDHSAFLCITSRDEMFDAMIWKVDIDWDSFYYVRRLYSILFLVSLVLLCLIGYFNMRRLSVLVRNEERYETEIENASMIQKSMLPKTLFNCPAIDLDAVLHPSAAVGGDCYYYYEKDGLLYFCIGDVVGKGLSAALLMGKVVSLFHNISQYYSKVDEIAQRLNRELCNDYGDLMFVTLFMAVLDIRTGRLDYCNAGHEDPVFWNGDASSEPCFLHTEHDIPLGVEPDMTFSQRTVQIVPGSMICVYTDGVNEARNSSFGMFGRENLLRVFSQNRDKDSSSINSSIVSSVRDFAGKCPQSDDITILTIKARPIDYTLVMENKASEEIKLRDLFSYLKDYLYCTDTQLMEVRVALDEAVTNCILYAYGDGNGTITVRASSDVDNIIFTIEDSGVPFNLLEYDVPGQNCSDVEEMVPGGLGIPLIKRTFDEIEYRRVENRNILILKKSLKLI